MFVIYLDANVVENCKQMDKLEAVDFSLVDLQMITDIASQENLFSLIVNSLCPTIFGHQLVKAGLMLALFAGTRRGHDKDTLPIRSDSHVLVVGDPGLGKSQLLQAVSNVAPRGVYVCGSYSSSSGLTVTLFKEKGSGDYALEAGALILGDQGVCCIDEFDKMPNEHQSLLEAMEQQSISIAKAGIVCSLPARTAVIAAANPVGGHYNRAKTVAENLKMSEAVLSRFDLVFILLDKPDEQRDQMISDHVMALHSAQKKVHRKRKKVENEEDPTKRKSLLQRLDPSLIPADTLIPPLLVRKYIAYAKKYVSPKLSVEASVVLQNFYISLRKKHRASDSTPITTRQLESLIRLSEAKAKAELRDVVTEEDARDVVELMQSSLFDLFEDEYGNLDFRRTTGVSKSGQVKAFVQALSKVAARESNSVFTKVELNQVMSDINLRLDISFDDFIDRLNIQGFLLKSGPNAYKLVAA
ncbi:MCM8 protein [Acanthamoeba castellanii str. Neff]|uniref:DNA helicase n=1 Tax=Acanthamoeba castellanii (strain ATCC 30010 / Neff) TaxID=1257118 RepID=L8GY26_ACACF|nr:MCM8 protein [Acanthamoeba castellanii str. Neff]ELR17905.1 MCM8 protein [Acanthamoeba castellanii str. Neff]